MAKTGRGLYILDMFCDDEHSWPLSREGSLACHTNCESQQHGAYVYNGHLRGPVKHILLSV